MDPCKKNAERMGAHIAFIDESGFMLMPPVRRTWGPRGRTPQTRHQYRHDRISLVSAITVSPRRMRVGLYYRLHSNNIRQEEVCEFLRHLLRHLRGPVIVVWDNYRIHKAKAVSDLCRRFARLHLESLPPYAPELNPDEGVWNQLKGSLANGRPDDVEELSSHLTDILVDMRGSQKKLRWCIHQSQLPFNLP